MIPRRSFIGLGAGLAAGGLAWAHTPPLPDATRGRRRGAGPLLRPRRLQAGDLVGVANPSRSPVTRADIQQVTRHIEGLGVRVRCGERLEDCASHRPVSDRAHADEINALFADPEVKAVVALRGGWGCARLLPHLDYALIRSRPKIVMGFSDVSALLLGIHARAGLVTFHGPMGISRWVPFTTDSARDVLFRGEAPRLESPSGGTPERPFETLVPGAAEGRLLGGNLTVLTSLLGSPYLELGDEGIVLFLEEVLEPLSEVDRMFTQLRLAGVLERARAVVFGQCTGCVPPAVDSEMTLDMVLRDHLVPLGIPAWRGALIGHIERQVTLPLGIRVAVDATRGTIRFLERAVE